MKFEKGRLKFVIPTTVVVFVTANIMLFTKYKSIPSVDKFMILLGAVCISFLLAYFLFPQDKNEKPDEIPSKNK
jgi:Mn2+/Fe2+ NRAMP family transporter